MKNTEKEKKKFKLTLKGQHGYLPTIMFGQLLIESFILCLENNKITKEKAEKQEQQHKCNNFLPKCRKQLMQQYDKT